MDTFVSIMINSAGVLAALAALAGLLVFLAMWLAPGQEEEHHH